MWGLRTGDGGGVARLPPHDATRQSTGAEMGMDRRGHGRGRRGRETNVQAGVPQGGDNGVPSQRVTGEGRDADGDARTLLEEARTGHYHHLGWGRFPSSSPSKNASKKFSRSAFSTWPNSLPMPGVTHCTNAHSCWSDFFPLRLLCSEVHRAKPFMKNTSMS